MVYYTTYQDNRKNVGTHKYYARAVHTSTMNTRAMAKHIMEHGGPYTEDVVMGVLMKYRNCMVEQLLEGNKVKIDGVGIFYLTLKTTGAESEEEFTATDNIKALRIRMLPSSTDDDNYTSKELLSMIEVKKAPGFVKA
jgi:predicted histone-like DNA-binding protein